MRLITKFKGITVRGLVFVFAGQFRASFGSRIFPERLNVAEVSSRCFNPVSPFVRSKFCVYYHIHLLHIYVFVPCFHYSPLHLKYISVITFIKVLIFICLTAYDKMKLIKGLLAGLLIFYDSI